MVFKVHICSDSKLVLNDSRLENKVFIVLKFNDQFDLYARLGVTGVMLPNLVYCLRYSISM